MFCHCHVLSNSNKSRSNRSDSAYEYLSINIDYLASLFLMSVSVVDSCLMTSHRDLFPVVASLNKLSLTSTERYKCVVPPQEDMITDKDEVPTKPQSQQAEVSVYQWLLVGASTGTTLKPHEKACVYCLLVYTKIPSSFH